MKNEHWQRFVKFAARFSVGVAVAMMGTSAGVAVAANGKCRYVDAQINHSSYTEVVPTPPGYLACYTDVRMIGTLNGIFTSCNTDAAIAFPGPDQVYGGYADDTIVTREGELVLREYNMMDYDRLVFTSLLTIDPQNSTGAFQGMVGTLIGSQELVHYYNPRGAPLRVTGYLCPSAP